MKLFEHWLNTHCSNRPGLLPVAFMLQSTYLLAVARMPAVFFSHIQDLVRISGKAEEV